MNSRPQTILATFAAVLIALAGGAICGAQEAPAPATRPILEELNRETQTLYTQAAQGIVRVQLPMRTDALSMLGGGNPLAKWQGQIDAQTLQRLNQVQQRVPSASIARVEIEPSSNQPGPGIPNPQPHVIILTLSGFWPNSMGAVIDDQGHVMVPHYVDREAFDQTIPVALADGRVGQAEFVASDKQTDLTILKLQNIKSTPIALGTVKPGNGSLMLVVSLNPAFNRLAVWTGGTPDLAIAVGTDGSLAGFTANGRFRDAAACKPIARELIDNGQVRRPVLGVVIETVPADDPQRIADANLHNVAALRIKKVFTGSAAERAGLQAGDLILKVAGDSVGDGTGFAAVIARSRGKTEVVLLREGQQMKVDVDLQVQ